LLPPKKLGILSLNIPLKIRGIKGVMNVSRRSNSLTRKENYNTLTMVMGIALYDGNASADIILM